MCSPLSSAAHSSVVYVCVMDRSQGPREIPLLLLPSPSRNSTFAEAAGTAQRGSAGQQKVGLWHSNCGVLNAKTLPSSYQTTPQFIRTPSLHPMPPLTHTACVLPAGRSQAWKAAGGAAAGPTDIFSFSEAGDQAVAGGNGGCGRLFRDHVSSVSGLASRFSAAKSLGRGSGGLTCALDRPCSCQNVYNLMFVI